MKSERMDNISCRVRRGMCKRTAIYFEWYKMLISQRGFYVLLFYLVFLCIVRIESATLLAFISLILLITGLFCCERQSSMEALLRSMPYGCAGLDKRKYKIVVMLTAFFGLLLVCRAYPDTSAFFTWDNLICLVRLSLFSGIYCLISLWLKNRKICIIVCSLSLIPVFLCPMGAEKFCLFCR